MSGSESSSAEVRCEIVVVLDRSGSMESIKSDMEGGFDAFVASQRAQEGEALMTLVQFDTQGIDSLFTSLPVAEVPKLRIEPRGGTPLLDAVGRTLTDSLARFSAPIAGQRSPRVVFMIITDGHENASREFRRGHVKALIELAEARGWLVMYLGANVDAFAEGGAMGIREDFAAAYGADSEGVDVMMNVVTDKARKFRRGASREELAFSPDERERMHRPRNK